MNGPNTNMHLSGGESGDDAASRFSYVSDIEYVDHSMSNSAAFYRCGTDDENEEHEYGRETKKIGQARNNNARVTLEGASSLVSYKKEETDDESDNKPPENNNDDRENRPKNKELLDAMNDTNMNNFNGNNNDDDNASRLSNTEFNPYWRGYGDADDRDYIVPETITSTSAAPEGEAAENGRETDDGQAMKETAQTTPKRDSSLMSYYKKEEADDESEDRPPESNDANSYDDLCEKRPKIKGEPTIFELQHKQSQNQRKYGDRVLLARQAANGMMKLGGGNTTSYLWPKDLEKHDARMNGRYAIAYNDLWNFGAPKYAGQPFGHVTMYPKDDREGHHCDPTIKPFSVFVKRTIKGTPLGWEYCGEYILTDDLPGVVAAHCVSQSSKDEIIGKMKASLMKPSGEWHERLSKWKVKVESLLAKDSSPAGPTPLMRLAEQKRFETFTWSDDVKLDPQDSGKERQNREEKESREKASSAAKARALGFERKGRSQLTDIEFADRLIHFDDFYMSYSIKFDEYDEEMYNFVKAGETTKNKANKPRKSGESCAKACDWYAIDDQVLLENDREIRDKRTYRRKRCKVE